MRPALAPLAVLVLLVLAACGSGSAGNSGAASSSPAPSAASSVPSQPAADDALVVELDRGAGAEPERYTLTCAGPVAGDLPAAAAACTYLQGLGDPFAPIPEDAACTQQYGGPQTARVTGRWAGEPVDRPRSRTDGCRIAQWDRLGPLLPGPVS